MVNLFQNQELSGTISRFLYFPPKGRVFRLLRKTLRLLFSAPLPPVYECEESKWRWRRQIKRDVKMCKKNGADFIVFCMHEGGQYNSEPTRRTLETAEFLIKSGVDAVIGNHEHVVHPFKFEGGKIKTHSLGNFSGTTGVCRGPYDKMAEYSVLFNMYLTKADGRTHIEKCTFSVMKSILNDGGTIKTAFLFDLINSCACADEKEKLLADNLKIVNVFLGTQYVEVPCEREYNTTL